MNAIVVADQNWAIGREDHLLFSLPQDMSRFRTLTLNGTVILGRRTLETFPGGRPLPERRNIVISKNAELHLPETEIVHSPQAALELAGDVDSDQLWVIGGGSVYAALLPQCRKVYLTRVDAQVDDADTFFPNLDKLPGWEIERTGEPVTENGMTYRFVDYINTRLKT